jgi:peptidoglycan/LPS O-acetylase OafA/YrhL
MPSRHPIPGLDGLRALAALAVVALHAWLFTGGRDGVPPGPLDHVFNELRVGVTLFFVLSAYLLAGPWVRARSGQGDAPRTGAFFVRRAARIVPAYWIAIGLAMLAAAGTTAQIDPRSLAWFAVFAHNQVDGLYPLNPPLWSLGVEVAFYVVLPLLGWAMTRRGPLVVAGAMVALGLVWSTLVAELDWPLTTVRALPTFLPTFGCGIAAAALAHRRPPGARTAPALLGGGWLLVVANSWWHVHGDGALGPVLRDLPAAIGFAAVVVAIAHRPPGLLDRWPLRRLGELSYGVYAFHWPVAFWLWRTDRLPGGWLGAYALVAGTTIALAAVSWVLVERPAIRLGRYATARRSRPVSRATAVSTDSMAVSGNSSSVPQRVQIAS